MYNFKIREDNNTKCLRGDSMEKLFSWLRKDTENHSEQLEIVQEEEYDFDFYDVVHNFERKNPLE